MLYNALVGAPGFVGGGALVLGRFVEFPVGSTVKVSTDFSLPQAQSDKKRPTKNNIFI
jgi:hypothetical protein